MAKKRKIPAGWRVHPGEILREEFLKPMGLTAYELARRIRVPVPRINDLVLERRGVTADTAIRLARYFSTSELFWMNLQSTYEVYKAQRRLARDLGRIEPARGRSAA